MYCHTVWCIVTHRVFCVVLDLLMHCRRIAGVLSPTFRFVFRLFSDVLLDNLLCCHAFWCTVIVLHISASLLVSMILCGLNEIGP